LTHREKPVTNFALSHATCAAYIAAYDEQKGKANITGQAAELMQPEVIDKMKTIKGQIEGNFL
jgi:hypothetical protein